MGKNYYSDALNDSVQFTALKFYVGNICLISDANEVDSVGKMYHLIDWEIETTHNLQLPNVDLVNVSKVSFTLGVDSITNYSGALGGDLDPTKGMYWTWQTGYINFKLEGKSPVCKTRNNAFVFHLGGFQEPFYAIQSLSFSIKDKQEIHLVFDLDLFLKQIDLINLNHIMSPSVDAVNLSKKVASSFNIYVN